ncbi:MAG TPA: insulinase family protein [Clostridiaceae bacterium]|nr:insulinase family protein [Clostridiaceae bacterium]
MQKDLLLEERARKVSSFNGIDVYQIRTGKFKTNSINIFFHDDLKKENASKNAMVPAVLRRGTVSLPTFKDIALYLEELYGASFDCGVIKKGERQIIHFYIEFVSDEFIKGEDNLFEKAFNLLYDIIAKPVLENGIFKNEYVEQEKNNLKNLIESRINDKVQYAVDRCYEEMCKGEPFEIYDYGAVEDVGKIDSKSLYEHYLNFIRTYPAQVYICGNVADDVMHKAIQMLENLRVENKTLQEGGKKINVLKGVSPDSFNKSEVKTKNVTEKLNVNQGKLSLGFRTNTPPDSNDYYALVVYNGILGGGIHSKLFQNVREKASLAYYVFSRLEKFKGLMVVSSGIEIENKDKALDIILDQLEQIRAGNISDYEYETTLNVIETGIKSLRDNQISIVDFYLSQTVAGTNDDFKSFAEKIRKVTKEDVIRVADKIKLDTIYFLTRS